MLDKHLIAKTSPKANPLNVVTYKDYRITVLFDRLFRIEKSDKGLFTDEATQSVWFRDMPAVNFTVEELEDGIIIITDKTEIFVADEYKKSYAAVNGKNVPLTNKGNLKGTYRTLDGYCGSVSISDDHPTCPLEEGVCSRTGVAIIDDRESLILGKDGDLKDRLVPEADDYVFVYGHEYEEAVKALYKITGSVPLVPRYALGNWWSRYHVYTQDEYLNILRRFEDRDVPFTVATIDMDWHPATKVDEDYNLTKDLRKAEYGTDPTWGNGWLGWTGYSWNKNLFPDYKRLLKDIKEMNLKITLNLHPKDGVRFFEDQYKDMCAAMNKTPDKTPVEFDMTDDNFINNYFKILHKPYENDGVDFWWIDWQQGTRTKKTGLDPLWCLNHYHYLDNAVNHKDPLILSRYCKIGSHRYPVGFSGDTTITYGTLNYLPYFTATASNVGYTWWSHDIGGHFGGETDNELYVRSIQYGAFSPIMRLHCTEAETLTKEPWVFMNGSGLVAEEYLRFRHSMIPYIYSEGYKVHTYGETLIKPLYYKDPENENAYKYRNEYYFGELLVCPITGKSIYNGIAELEVWFPEGTWTDIFTGEVYYAGKNGKTMKIYRWLDTIPVFAKAGTILPLSGDKHTNSVANPVNLELNVFEGDGEYKLYEDGGDKEMFTIIKTEVTDGKSVTTISVTGDKSVLPSGRTVTLKLKNCNGKVYSVTADGEPVDYKTYTDEYAVVIIKNIEFGKTYVVTADVADYCGYFERRSLDSLKKFEYKNNDKNDIYHHICNEIYSREKNAWVVKRGMFKPGYGRLYEICSLFNLPDIYFEKLNETIVAMKK